MREGEKSITKTARRNDESERCEVDYICTNNYARRENLDEKSSIQQTKE